MKKRIILTMITLLVVSLLYGCGSKEVTPQQGDNEEPEIMIEVPDEQPIEEVPEVSTGTYIESDIDLNEFEADEAIDHQFGDVSYIAQYRDIRETTGLYSESTDDVWNYLTDDGIIDTTNVDEYWEYGAQSYTGRWAYPTLLESEATKDFYLYDWTDSFCSYIADEGENNNAILICPGYDVFNQYTTENEELGFVFEEFGTYDINDNSIEVYSAEYYEDSITYMYKLGGFTVVIEFMSGEDVTSEDLLLEVMNDIVL